MPDGGAGRRREERPGAKNVLGGTLLPCSIVPLTGFFRDGCCNTGPSDLGLHVVCAEMSGDFLEFSRARGNDLSTPMPASGFPGLTPGDRWCLCAARWEEARQAGRAPLVLLEATHEAVLRVCRLEDLRAHAVNL